MLPNEYSVQCFLKNRCKYRAMFLLEGESRQKWLIPKFSLSLVFNEKSVYVYHMSSYPS